MAYRRRYRSRRTFGRRTTVRRARKWKNRKIQKARFKRTLREGAMYYKVKTAITFETGEANQQMRFMMNFNGKETVNSNTDVNASMYLQQGGSGTAYAVSNNDMPVVNQQWDQNRLAATQWKWLPGLPEGGIRSNYKPMFIAYDKDGIDQYVTQMGQQDFLQQSGYCKVKNMCQPWKIFVKAPKQKLNTRYGQMPQLRTDDPTMYEANTNIAGLWKGVDVGYPSWMDNTQPAEEIGRAFHLVMMLNGPDAQQGDMCGTLIVTNYYVYKDRR